MKCKLLFLMGLILFLPFLFAELNQSNETEMNFVINESSNQNINLTLNESVEKDFNETNKTEINITLPNTNISNINNETNLTFREENLTDFVGFNETNLTNETIILEIFDFLINTLAEGNSYFTNLFTIGSQGSKIIGVDSGGRFILTSLQAGTSNGQGEIYLANIGFLGNSTFEEAESIIPVVPPSTGGGGSGVVSPVLECINDTECNGSSFCFENKCYAYECDADEDCEDDKTCWIHRCVKLFDMKIIEIESPIYPGEFFNFTYFLKGVAEIHGDVIVRFWVEKDGQIVTEGFDTIYMGDFEERTESTELFLPATILPDIYNFYAEVNYDSYYARAGRVIEIQEPLDGIEEELPGGGFFTGQTIAQVGEGIRTNILPILISVGTLALLLIIYWERKKIKKALVQEEKLVKKYRISFATGFLILILITILFNLIKFKIINFFPLNLSFTNLFEGIFILFQRIFKELFFLIKEYVIYLIIIILLILLIIFREKIKRFFNLSNFFKKLKITLISSFGNFKKVFKKQEHELELKRKEIVKEELLRKKKFEEEKEKRRLLIIKKSILIKRKEKRFLEKFKLSLISFFNGIKKDYQKQKHELEIRRKKAREKELLKIKRIKEEQERKRILKLKRQKIKLTKQKRIQEEKERKRLLAIKERKLFLEKIKNNFVGFFKKIQEEAREKRKKQESLRLKKMRERREKERRLRLKKIEEQKFFRVQEIKRNKEKNKLLKIKEIEERKLSQINKIKLKKERERLLKLGKIKSKIEKMEKPSKISFDFLKKIKIKIPKKKIKEEEKKIISSFLKKEELVLKPERKRKRKNLLSTLFKKIKSKKKKSVPKEFLKKELVPDPFSKEEFIPKKNFKEKSGPFKEKQNTSKSIPKEFLKKEKKLNPFSKEEFIPKKNSKKNGE